MNSINYKINAMDHSIQLYNKYFSLKNKKVTITLKDKIVLNGLLIGFYKGDEDMGESYILKWHFIEPKDEKDLRLFGSDYVVGKIIKQNEIKKIQFEEDETIMIFTN